MYVFLDKSNAIAFIWETKEDEEYFKEIVEELYIGLKLQILK